MVGEYEKNARVGALTVVSETLLSRFCILGVTTYILVKLLLGDSMGCYTESEKPSEHGSGNAPLGRAIKVLRK